MTLRSDVEQLYAQYASYLDQAKYADWLDLFAGECSYTLIPRENFDAGLPLATLALESRAMMEDRIYGITTTLFHAPYYQRHIIGPILIGDAGDGRVAVEANFLVIRTRRDQPSEILCAGRYLDTLVTTDAGLRLAVKRCVFDSELIPNSIIYPI